MMGKQSAGGNAESMIAILAAPLLAGTNEIMGVNATTGRANRITLTPTGFSEQIKRLLISHGEDLHQ